MAGTPAFAGSECPEATPATFRPGTFSIIFENDLFADRDENYTNGLQLGWVSGDLSAYRDDPRLPDWSRPLIEHLPFIHDCGLQRSVALALGQKIFTPRDISRRDLIRDDRPYAGWLYGSAAFHNKNIDRLDTVELQLGVVGPAALGEQAQNTVHRLRGIPTARGWSNQLHNEPGLMLIYEHKRRLLRGETGSGWGMDVIGHFGAALGNVHTYLSSGMEARVGWNIPADFGTSLIRPGGENSAPVDSNAPRYRARQRAGFHAFAAVMGRAVLRDIFLDGNTIGDSHSVDRRSVVGDLVTGFGLTWRGVKLTYARVFRTREFDGQEHGHRFGSLSLSFSL
ncbi:MAG: lipid A deacylase LpxR family protein [Gammaproteobacteria bacterium]|nr:MAG: lipid A deacylase LpxR family protein [Gammaproteobacteria bacterium]